MLWKVLTKLQRNYDEELVKEINSLQRLTESRAPGTDGLPAEFYKVFWNDISDLFLNSINYAYRSSQLSVTQRRGIIKLIPKKDAEPNLIKNWRPISLINCDYKIAVKLLPIDLNRLSQILLTMTKRVFLKVDLLEKIFDSLMY